MEVKKKKRMDATSKTNDNSRHLPDSVHKSQQVKLPEPVPSTSSLVLLPSNFPPLKKSKKKSKERSKVISVNSNWVVTPIKDSEANFSESDCNESHVLEDVSPIKASSADKKIYINNEDKMEFEEANGGFDTDLKESEDILYQKMRNKWNEDLKKSQKQKKKNIGNTGSVRIHPIFLKNMMVLLMNHPASATIHRYVSVKVLSGSASVNGFEFNSENPPVRVFSSNRYGLMQLKTESCDAIWMVKEGFKKLSNELKKITEDPDLNVQNIFKYFCPSTVVVILVDTILPPRLQFVELYYPDAVKFNITKEFKKKFNKIKHLKKTYILSNSDSTINFTDEVDEVVSDILAAIRSSLLQSLDGPRILVFGPQSTGKSSLLRYLMNRTISMFPSVCFLDADPRRPEFTPPGVISVTHVTKPVFGPPFCHQRTPLAMTFTGDVSTFLSLEMYSKSVSRMAEVYRNSKSSEALFVNTMDCVKGLGLMYLEAVMKTVMPTILIEIVCEEDDSMFDYQEHLTDRTRIYQIHCPLPRRLPSDQDIKDEQSLSLLSYIGKSQLIHKKPQYVNGFQPACISWENIPIYLFTEKVPLYKLPEAINPSFVALCRVHESLILETSCKPIYLTLREEPENDCLGFGIVRAIHKDEHLLYVATPMDLNELQPVNAILKGNIEFPPPLILEQRIYGVPLPFTNEKKIVLRGKYRKKQDNSYKFHRTSEDDKAIHAYMNQVPVDGKKRSVISFLS